MYTAEDYLQGWIAYSIGGLFLLSFLWYLLRNLRFAVVRHVLILTAAAFLFTPVTAYRDDAHLAPAFNHCCLTLSVRCWLVTQAHYAKMVGPISLIVSVRS